MNNIQVPVLLRSKATGNILLANSISGGIIKGTLIKCSNRNGATNFVGQHIVTARKFRYVVHNTVVVLPHTNLLISKNYGRIILTGGVDTKCTFGGIVVKLESNNTYYSFGKYKSDWYKRDFIKYDKEVILYNSELNSKLTCCVVK